jgi:cell division protein FtsA
MSEFAEEILGMPVRIGYPVGIKGITQLVQGPQFATGVGLVKFGAQALAHAREAGVAHTRVLAARRSTEAQPQAEAPPRKAKFLQWLKAAF